MDKLVILDFGGQYSHLISRRIRDIGVYSEVLPSDVSKDELIKIKDLKGIILSGGAASVYDDDAPKCNKSIFGIGIPILGICYGHQLIAYLNGGEVALGESGEYGITELRLLDRGRRAGLLGKNMLLNSLNTSEKVWMNHCDIVRKLPEGYSITASTDHSPIAAFENGDKQIYGVQFHPEVTHTEHGNRILENFALDICNAKRDWKTSNIIANITAEIKQKIASRKVILGLSGGVDSSTSALLVSRVIGENLTAVYVDTGLMRYRETEFIQQIFSKSSLKLRVIKAHERFFNALRGVTDPEEKRKIIGKTFIDVFDEVAEGEAADVLVQGTIYSDRIESGITKHSSRIKSHHNVGGLPDNMKLEIYEPLRDLYKDEVRRLAMELGLPDEIITRHVFPGPGLGIRILGEVTPEKADIVRRASFIVEDELRKAGLYERVWMGFAVLLPIKSVGIQGDARSYKYPVVVRIIESKDAMTTNFAKLPYEILEAISTRITNEIHEVNRVVYDISNKPPATMEWE
ncbi:glutamine-hydrolyzing GMP synthase [Candidatus Woesearchaeota archaeon CG1_02_47_18]|nr:MAG: glutamine-hydrolyzing GMP synthase [Candidatus Woesearchaeota archaeon CG1_02_47_18]